LVSDRLGRTGQTLKGHASQILKVRKDVVPWAWMFISGLATAIPLIIGFVRNEAAVSIFGALTGYFIGLCDHRAPLWHRLLIVTVSAAICWFAFVVGLWVQNSLTQFIFVVAVMVALLGLWGGRGAELERIVLFAAANLVVARYATTLNLKIVPAIDFYAVVAFVTVIVGIFVSRYTIQKTYSDFISVKQSFRMLLTRDRAKYYYAIIYIFAAVFSILCVEYFQINRGYWIVVTVLFMMKPDRKESIYRIIQRLLGTLLGVVTGHFLISEHFSIPWMISGVFGCAFMVPYVWNRNYWLVAFLATNLVILLLSIAQYGHIDGSITSARVKATLYGCAISLVVMLIFRIGEWALARLQPRSIVEENDI
jgi:hypothetical protein